MKIHLLSDLHLELSQYQPAPAAYSADVVVLAGDIWKKDYGMYMARSMFPDQQIVMILGNHEHYGQEIHQNIAKIRAAAAELGIHLLENDKVIIQGTRFLGCTLWTDFELFGSDQHKSCLLHAQQYLNDFRRIRNGEWDFNPADSIAIHKESLQWLKSKLNESFDGPTIVVTHHGPCWKSVAPRYQNDLLSACFSSRLDHLMDGNKVELWCHGHTHDSFNYSINGTCVITNPRGYNRSGIEGNQENARFNPNLIIEVRKKHVQITDVSDVKHAPPIPKKISAKQRDKAVWTINHLEPQPYGEFGVKYIDLGVLEPELQTHVKSILLRNNEILEVLDHEAILPMATFNIEWLITEIINRSE